MEEKTYYIEVAEHRPGKSLIGGDNERGRPSLLSFPGIEVNPPSPTFDDVNGFSVFFHGDDLGGAELWATPYRLEALSSLMKPN